MSTRPPRWLESLVERRLSADPHGDTTLGDLAEGYVHIAARSGPLRARLWYFRHALSLALRGSSPRSATGATASRLERATQVLRFALRTTVRRPVFAVAVCGVLGATIAATFAAFSVTAGTWDAAHWWQAEERTILVWPEYPFSRGQLDVLRTETRVFETVGGILRQPAVIALEDRTASAAAVELSTELFDQLRARPVIGRGLLPEDGVADAEPVVVLGHALWRTVFGGAPDVLDRIIEVNGVRRRVVGVMPAGAAQPGPGSELWMPLILDMRDPDFWPARELAVAAITRPGTTVLDARADVRRVLGDLARRFSFFFRPDFGSDATVVSSAQRSWGAVATPLLLLLAGSVLLLLVAAIDVGNLVLARSLERRNELRVRVAIGASRGQVVAHIAAEAALQALLAGLAGGGLGMLLARRVPGLFPFGTPVAALDPSDPRLLAFLVLTTLAAWALTAGIPTAHFLAATRRNATTERFVRTRATRGLVIAQAALSTTLMISAALLFRTVQRLEDLPLGFRADDVAVVPVAPPTAPLRDGSITQLHSAVAARVAATPSVHGAGWISTVPLLDPITRSPVNLEERQVEVAQAPMVARFVTDAEGLAALGVEVVSGRGFAATDDATGASVALVNRTMARQLWPDADPVGRLIAVDPHGWTSWITVVGVIEDLRFESLTLPLQPAYFLPRQQVPSSAMSLVVRASADPAAFAPVVRAALQESAPDAAAGNARALRGIVRDAQGPARVMTSLLSVLALLAALLGAVGLYGTMAGWVARRRFEIGTRLALGASPRRLSGGILATGAALTGVGILMGLLGAAMAGRAIRSLLFGVSPLDPVAFLVPAAGLLVVGILAATLPALRAAAVPPAEALRST